MKLSYISLRWKLLSGFVGLVVIIVLSLLISVSQIVDSRIRQDIDTNFVEAGRVFERIQDIRFRQLRQTAILLADIPSLKAAISTGDTVTVNQKIQQELRYLLDFDPVIPDTLIPEEFYANPDSAGLLLISDSQGRPLGQLSTRELPQFSIADRPGVTHALNGNMPSQTYIWKEDHRYFNVITIPIWAGRNLVGTLSYGFPIRQLETEQLSRDIGLEVIFYVDDQLLAGSFKKLSSDDETHLSKMIHEATFETLRTKKATTSEIVLDGKTWLIYLAPMFEITDELEGIRGYYAVAKSLTEALGPLQSLQLLIFGIGIIAIAASILISIWLTRRITKPIDLLVAGVHRVEKEDFSREVPITSNDEIGKLTSAFNNLAEGLRERLLMLKFVSEATLDAIKKNISRIEPGGERRNITVLFSDIRGFTSWSENHSPEEVIDMLNNLLSFQAELVKQFGGDVDKFVGDELVAVFQGKDKDQKAVNAAIRIQKKITSMLEGEQEELAVGIGINSGEAVMGAMGSENRMDYTVLGNTVNLGARLCTAAQKHQILISNSVFLNLERKIPVSELDQIQVKGIEKPITIYEINWKDEIFSATNEEELHDET
ncbi:MAG: HAMP domain-containing protein [Gracilimonas sp.]|uniref:adenylate/guanylate cyclase domain-containing protein n=1 Tax=Gracilimonas sp. TaxID=1974203 RepID=UPI0019A67640|nr:adenylate/guanylate cyclase domain-containing protein [Gracilimonas sp.]MBD3616077.1 HAMP domain-containing protein [Gracilimonas sp.]